jgi:hypothetical protein
MRTWEIEVQSTVMQRMLIEADCFDEAIHQAESGVIPSRNNVTLQRAVKAIKEVANDEDE